jgi:hypothetical protein
MRGLLVHIFNADFEPILKNTKKVAKINPNAQLTTTAAMNISIPRMMLAIMS